MAYPTSTWSVLFLLLLQPTTRQGDHWDLLLKENKGECCKMMEIKLGAWICSEAALNFVTCNEVIIQFLTFPREVKWVNREKTLPIFVRGSLWDSCLINDVCFVGRQLCFFLWGLRPQQQGLSEVSWHCRSLNPSNSGLTIFLHL